MACFLFNETATTAIYTLSLHDALPIWCGPWWPVRALRALRQRSRDRQPCVHDIVGQTTSARLRGVRSEEHTSELQSQSNLVCRLLLEKKNSTTRLVQCSVTISRWRPPR